MEVHGILLARGNARPFEPVALKLRSLIVIERPRGA
jgi:hypothetical protein